MPKTQSDSRIWLFAFGYFICYVPYSALTKALSVGAIPGGALTGLQLLPGSVIASLVAMMAFIFGSGWWRYAHQTQLGGLTIPRPSPFTLISGIFTAAVIVTTTLSYTFEGVSIIFAMLLMRGGVLVMAPVVDVLSNRRVRWFSWAGFALSLVALFVAFAEKRGFGITVVCAINVGVYLLSYFVRLRLMSRLAKSDLEDANRRYFVEEQLVATPLVLVAFFVVAFFGQGEIANQLRFGFIDIWAHPALMSVLLAGLCSQGTGVFGVLMLLDKSENTFCVPVNRCSSVLAGLVASFILAYTLAQKLPGNYELAGAFLVVGAILFLTIPPLLAKRNLAMT